MTEQPVSDADNIQIELLRKATPSERLSIAIKLSEKVIALSRQAIARAHPEYSEQEVKLKFVELNYGKSLAVELREYLRKNHPEKMP